MTRANEKVFLLGLAFAVSTLLVVELLLLTSASHQRQASTWVTQSRDKREKLNEVLTRLNEAELECRRYVLSGHPSYWSQHTDKVTRVHAALGDLRMLLSDNPEHAALRDHLEALVFRRLAIFTNSIKARQANGPNIPEQIQFMEEGLRQQQPIDTLVSRMTGEESALLEQRQALQKENSDGVKGFALIVTALGLGLSAAFLGLFVRANRRRHGAEEKLRQTNADLERRVEERTTEIRQNLDKIESLAFLPEALRDSEARFRTLTESVPQLVWTCQPDGACDFLSRQWIEYTGCPAEKQFNYGWAEHLHPDDRERVTNAWRAAVSTGDPYDVEFRIRRADGVYRWFKTRAVPLRDAAGEIVKWIGSNTDMEDYKRSEQHLHTQLERLNLLDQTTRAIGERQHLQSIFQVVVRSLEDHLPVDFGCVCTCDSDDEFLTVKHVGEKSLLFAADLNLTEQTRIDPGEQGLLPCMRGQLVYEPDVREADFPFLHRMAQGGLRSLVLAPLMVENRAFGILVGARREPQGFSSGDCEFLRQLSGHVALAAHQAQLYDALQQAYDELRQSQQMVMQQDRLRALGQMASGIAHDINNAISPVALYTDSLLEQEPSLSPRARNYLNTIRQAIRDVAETVARMREFYRPREPQLTLIPVHLGQLVHQVLDLTRARWNDMPQQRGAMIHLKTELADGSPAILGIESELREALINLVLNAVDAMPDGGTLTLRTRILNGEARLPHAARFHSVCIEVADTGLGMDEDTCRRCMEPFFTTKGERGTGLGLAMVYGVVQRHGAGVEIESAPGQGTTVRLSFVPSGPASEEPGPPPEVDLPPSRLRILVVDDDPLLVRSLRDTLETDGHVVVAAGGGQEGIELFRSARHDQAFAAVITDLGMPYVDGRKVASEVKHLSPSTPVIMLTGWGQRLAAEGNVSPHVDRVIHKPPRLPDLRDALVRCCPPSR